MKEFDELFEMALAFHGHKCPAMPLGLRAGLAALKTLGVERAQAHELFVLAEAGKGHASACFVDGIMAATGCTYGKSNIRKLYYNKMAFTLIERARGRAVRVALKPGFFAKALESPFIRQRKAGAAPQDIAPELVDPMIERIRSMDEQDFLDIGEIHILEMPSGEGVFEARACAVCGEMTFVDKLRVMQDGRQVCIPCSGYGG